MDASSLLPVELLLLSENGVSTPETMRVLPYELVHEMYPEVLTMPQSLREAVVPFNGTGFDVMVAKVSQSINLYVMLTTALKVPVRGDEVPIIKDILTRDEAVPLIQFKSSVNNEWSSRDYLSPHRVGLVGRNILTVLDCLLQDQLNAVSGYTGVRDAYDILFSVAWLKLLRDEVASPAKQRYVNRVQGDAGRLEAAVLAYKIPA